MDLLLLAARLVLVGLFTLSGLAKLADPPGSRKALVDFGVAAALASPAGLLLPLLELAVALALLATAWARVGAAAALLLLLLFSVAILVNLARGRAPECHCFGQLSSGPVGRATLLRNAGLAFPALLVLWYGPGLDLGSVLPSLSASELVALAVAIMALAVAAGEGWFLVHILRQQGRMLLRIEALESGAAAPLASAQIPGARLVGLPVGSPAPRFEVDDLEGNRRTLEGLLASGRSLLLLFFDPDCVTCIALLPHASAWQRSLAPRVDLVVTSRGDPAATRSRVGTYGFTTVLVEKEAALAGSFQVTGTPSAVLIQADGTMGSPLAEGEEAIRALVTQAARPSNDGRGNGRIPSPSGPARPLPN